jgi:hypothetical protein
MRRLTPNSNEYNLVSFNGASDKIIIAIVVMTILLYLIVLLL